MRRPILFDHAAPRLWLVIAVAVAVAAAGCAGGAGARGDGPDAPGASPRFVASPPPALPPPPAPRPGAPGLAYLEKVAPHLSGRWSAFLEDCRVRLAADHPLNRKGLAARLAIELDARGGLVAVSVERSSGLAGFDEAALEVVRDAVPLPPPPPRWKSDDGHWHLRWLFARDLRQAGPATATIERIQWPLERALPMLLSAGRVAEAAARLAADPPDQVGGDSAGPARVERMNRVCRAAIIRALADSDPASQLAGVDAAVRAHLAAAAPELQHLARQAMDSAVRRAALEALGQVGDRGAAPLLRRVAQGDRLDGPEDSGAAAGSLVRLGMVGDLGARAAAQLALTDRDARWTALAVMAAVPAPQAEPALAAMLAGDAREARADRLMAAAALGAVAGAGDGPGRAEAVSALTRCLAVTDAAQRAACAQALASAAADTASTASTAGAAGAAGRASAADPPGFGRATLRRALLLLRDPDERVRAAAVLVAARVDPRRFSRHIASVLRDPSEGVRTALAEGLARVPGRVTLAALERLVTDDSPQVRNAAAVALAGRSEPGAHATLTALAGRHDPAVRAVAARAERRPEVLRPLMDAPEIDVQVAALAALVAETGQAGTVTDAARRVAAADSPAARALLAAAWLAP